MWFVFEDDNGNRKELIGVSELAGYKYAKKHNLKVVGITKIEKSPEELTQAEIEEAIVDLEYRILLLEYGLEEEVEE